jgi:hypothetical protein
MVCKASLTKSSRLSGSASNMPSIRINSLLLSSYSNTSPQPQEAAGTAFVSPQAKHTEGEKVLCRISHIGVNSDESR